MSRFLACLCLIVSLGSFYVNSQSSCQESVSNQSLNTQLANGSLIFDLNLYKTLANQSNVFISPFSILVALAMTAAGAGGTTLSQMDSTLQLNGFQDQGQINQAFQGYLASLCPNPNYTLSTANSIYVQQNFPISQTYVQTLNTYYQSNAVNVNFQTNLSGAVSEINDFVADNTNNTIQNFFSTDSLSSNTILVLVNAIYFKGIWQTPFDPANTTPRAFSLANGQTVQTPTMYLQSEFPYTFCPSLNSQIVQLNYGGDRLAMHLILPQEGIELSTVQQALTPQEVLGYKAAFAPQQVQVYLPKFNVSFKQELNSQLQGLGIVDLFNSAAANLTGIASPVSNGNLYVSTVAHQAYVAVNEEGTTAVGSTGVGVVPLVSQTPIVFNVSRPFIFLICDDINNEILFIGNLNDPTS